MENRVDAKDSIWEEWLYLPRLVHGRKLLGMSGVWRIEIVVDLSISHGYVSLNNRVSISKSRF